MARAADDDTTRLTEFLTSLYDSFSEAELQALRHGHDRLAEIAADGTMPDAAVPVYHASDAQVTLDVGLVAEVTETGTEVFVTEAAETDASELGFTVDLFELLEQDDLDRSDEETDAGEPPDDEDEQREETEPERDEPPEQEREEAEQGGDEPPEQEREETEQEDEPPEQEDEPPIGVVDEIEPRYREILRAVGVERLSDLVERSPEEIADLIAEEDVDVSAEQAAGWLDDARGLRSILAEHDAALPVELVNGIGPTYGRRLREEGIGDMSTLAERSPEEIAEIASTGTATVSPERAAAWLDRAADTLDAMEELSDGRTAPPAAESNAAGSGAESDDITEDTESDDPTEDTE